MTPETKSNNPNPPVCMEREVQGAGQYWRERVLEQRIAKMNLACTETVRTRFIDRMIIAIGVSETILFSGLGIISGYPEIILLPLSTAVTAVIGLRLHSLRGNQLNTFQEELNYLENLKK